MERVHPGLKSLLQNDPFINLLHFSNIAPELDQIL